MCFAMHVVDWPGMNDKVLMIDGWYRLIFKGSTWDSKRAGELKMRQRNRGATKKGRS